MKDKLRSLVRELEEKFQDAPFREYSIEFQAYQKVAVKIQAILDSEPKGDWISAVDRLPGNGKLVVVRCYYTGDSTQEKFMVAYLKDGNWRESGGFDTIGGTGWIVEKWAPLPSPPVIEPTKENK